MRFLLLNPNTSEATTRMMLAIAREALDDAAEIDGMTATAGAAVITDEATLAAGAAEVALMTGSIADPTLAGVMIAAFGDPGLDAARARLRATVTGIAEASIAEAAGNDRRFSIVTTTPALDRAIRQKVSECGVDGLFAGMRYTRSGPAGMTDPDRLCDELREACALAAREDGAAAIVIGGGPLAAAARSLRHQIDAVLIEPIPAAIRAMLARADLRGPGCPA